MSDEDLDNDTAILAKESTKEQEAGEKSWSVWLHDLFFDFSVKPKIRFLRKAQIPKESYHIFFPSEYRTYEDVRGKYFIERTYQLSWIQRFFLTFKESEICLTGQIVSTCVLSATVISCVIYIVESVSSVKIAVETCDDPVCNNDPILCPGSMVCEPQPPDFYLQIELICVCFFLFDYASRLLTSWSVPPRLCGIYTPLLTEEDEALLISIEQPPEFFVEEECAKRLKGQNKTVAIDKESKEETEQSEETHDDLPSMFHEPNIDILTKVFRYLTQIPNAIDFIAILPFFLQFVPGTSSSSVTIVRVLRLARILRVLKIGKNSAALGVLFDTLIDSLPALGNLLFFSIIGLVLFASIDYFFEGGTYQVVPGNGGATYYSYDKLGNPAPSAYTNILVSIYWAGTTSTTVGYGDIFPVTVGGRFFAICMAYTGVLIIALPISVIGQNFDRRYDHLVGGSSEIVANAILNLISVDDDEDDDTVRKVTRMVKGIRLDENEGKFTHVSDAIDDDTDPDTFKLQHGHRITRELAIKLCAVFVISKSLLSEGKHERIIRALIAFGLPDKILNLRSGNMDPSLYNVDRIDDNFAPNPVFIRSLKTIARGADLPPGVSVDPRLEKLAILSHRLSFIVDCLRRDMHGTDFTRATEIIDEHMNLAQEEAEKKVVEVKVVSGAVGDKIKTSASSPSSLGSNSPSQQPKRFSIPDEQIEML